MHLLDLALGMRRLGHDVVILAGGSGVFLDRARSEGLRCRSLRYMVRQISPAKDLLAVVELRKTIKLMRPDVIHLHSSKAGILGRIAARCLPVAIIFTAHGWAFTEGVTRVRRILYGFIERLMAPFCDRIITVSDYDRKLALDRGIGNSNLLITVHNGMPDVEREAVNKSTAEATRIIMVARFDRPKKHLMLIEALALIPQLSWTLEFVGDGPLREGVNRYVQSQGLGERVVFSGSCNDVPRRLDHSDIFVLVSDWEGLPLAVLEAMRAGLPVIASNVGGVPEAVDDRVTGLLVGRHDVAELAAALEALIRSRELRLEMGTRGQEKFINEFRFEGMLRSTMEIYSSAFKAKTCRSAPR